MSQNLSDDKRQGLISPGFHPAVYKKMTFWPHKTISGTFAFDKRGHFVKESCGKVDMMTSLLSMQNAVMMVMIMMMKIH